MEVAASTWEHFEKRGIVSAVSYVAAKLVGVCGFKCLYCCLRCCVAEFGGNTLLLLAEILIT